MLTKKSPKLAEHFGCEKCDYKCSKESDLNKHLSTRKHINTYIDLQKVAEKFGCEKCDYKCSKESDFNKHLATRKHQNTYNDLQKVAEKSPKIYVCDLCNNKYLFRQSVYNHKKKCQGQQTQAKQTKAQQKKAQQTQAEETQSEETQEPEEKKPLSENEVKQLTHMVIELVKSNTELQKQNQDFQEKMLEMYKSTGNGSTSIGGNGNTINSHNKTFNMQFFLNEQCKDAMNITEFMDSFQLQFADLERIGEIGYVDGISELIIKKLNEMDIYKRPIHCSDTKRDIMYVRAENVWEKETNGHSRLRLFIKQITYKNIKLIPLWAATHPQAKDHEHPLNDNYLGMVSQAMGGRGNLEESENKIIKKIAKTVYIDKYQH